MNLVLEKEDIEEEDQNHARLYSFLYLTLVHYISWPTTGRERGSMCVWRLIDWLSGLFLVDFPL